MTPGMIVSLTTLVLLVIGFIRKDYRFTIIAALLLLINITSTFTDPWWNRHLW